MHGINPNSVSDLIGVGSVCVGGALAPFTGGTSLLVVFSAGIAGKIGSKIAINKKYEE